MAAGGFAFLAGTVLVTSAFATAQLVVGRLVLGVGVGLAVQATPLYLAELAPHHLRGALNILFQLAVTLGIFGAQLINYGTSHIAQPWGWRVSLGLGAVPSLIIFFGALALPDTPNSLVQRGSVDEGLKVLRRVRGTDDVAVEFNDIKAAVHAAGVVRVSPYRAILKRRYLPHLIISVTMMPLCQVRVFVLVLFFVLLSSSLSSDASSRARTQTHTHTHTRDLPLPSPLSPLPSSVF